MKKPAVLRDTMITFDEPNTSNNFLVHTTHFSHANLALSAHHNGYFGMLMTGGNAFTYYSMIEFPTPGNVWDINEFLSARVDFCVDATAWSEAHMHFDLKQTCGQDLYSSLIGPGNYTIASSLRVLVNDTIQIGGTYNPATSGSDPWETKHADLSAFAGAFFTMTFETRNIAKDTLIYKLDNAYIDNVTFSEEDQTGIEESNASDNVAAFPNPSDGKFWISCSSVENAPLTVNVIDMLGRSVYQAAFELVNGNNLLRIDLGNPPAGLYLVRTVGNNGSGSFAPGQQSIIISY